MGVISVLASGLAVAAALSSAVASPPVKVALRSSWPSPPLLLELIETVTLEEPDAFFPLLDTLTDPANLPSKEPLAPEALHQLALEAATSLGYLSSPGAFESVEMQLALHAATPKIEAFYQHYADTSKSVLESNGTGDCGSWVDWYGEVVCDLDRLQHLVGAESIESQEQISHHAEFFPRPKILPFDHIYPSPSRVLETPPRTAIFHASMTSENFRELHAYLMRMSELSPAKVEYVYRPIPSSNAGKSRVSLSGYGAFLDLKKMDYLALDDRHSHEQDSDVENPDATDGSVSSNEADHIVTLLSPYALNDTLGLNEPLVEHELAVIGHQTTQLVKDSETPFATFKQLIEDFPKYMTAIARRVTVSQELTHEVRVNSMKTQAGMSLAWLNGGAVSDADMNPFGLLRLLRKERGLMTSLTALGIEPSAARDLLAHPAISSASSNELLDGIFDASDRPEGGDLIVWWNDIEKDSRYARWPSSLYTLMRPTYPGQINVVRLNFYNAIVVVDLSRTSSLDYLLGIVSNMIERGFPIRFGIVPIADTESGSKMAKLFYYLVDTHGRKRTMAFFKKLLLSDGVDAIPEYVDMAKARSVFEYLANTEEPVEGKIALDFPTIIEGAGEDELARLAKARAYTKRLGADPASDGHIFANGKYHPLDERLAQVIQFEITQMVQYLQERIYEGTLSDESSSEISTLFYDLPTAQKRRNKHIVPAGGAKDVRAVNVPQLFRTTGFQASSACFIYPTADSVPLTIFVIADLDSEAGLSLVEAALHYVKSSKARVSFIHNPSSNSRTYDRHRASSVLSRLQFHGLLSEKAPERLAEALELYTTVQADGGDQTVLNPEAALEEITEGIAFDEDLADFAAYLKAGRLLAREFGIKAGDAALLVNGRIVGPIGTGEMTTEDFTALQEYELFRRVQPVAEALEKIVPGFVDLNKTASAELISMASSVVTHVLTPDPSQSGLFNQPSISRNPTYEVLLGEQTKFDVGNKSTSMFHFAVVLDPLSEHSQRYMNLLHWLSQSPHVSVEVHLHPAPYHDVPLKRFYRYNLLPRPSFDESGQEIPSSVVFKNLPIEPIYTLGLDEPSSWLVRPREALYDLDNIQLGVLSREEARRGVEATYELDYLIMGGHAREMPANAPARGVQLQLTTSKSEPVDDTLVLANLGYFQFKATPGVYRLEIREGRGREIYDLQSVGNEGWDSPTVEKVGDQITLTSFEGVTLYPRLVRLPGMELADVLQVDEEDQLSGLGSVVSRVKSFFQPKTTDVATTLQKHADINIFTVASGLLYERFASIMILSVLRNTNHTVKFWFIENFLSPTFLEFIPHFAEEYGFQYELVTYKWPTWLRQQREKQRIIWAYKILFLDILFPMDLDKVIFVDADQIVRTDLKELIDLDLHGAPYGYTPMGDDNTDMEGFRFWKTGYWQKVLQGKPYHISALYVVDLNRFRQLAAGDILRTHYQQLSADPNSLANLDQDLPNNLQMHVPIYSLPEDWLWCETWCSKDRLDRAKTIDLCQNPLTKEPKLARARQIPEWEVYDSEIARFTRRLAAEGRIQSSVAAADVNELANAGAAKAAAPSSSADEPLVDEASDSPEAPVRDEL
ncbi:hypothetical protein EVG20_g5315 [Dentipellis fragilis]|uniref:Glycosyltransferase family 24 protein n=1 Tax=Dentipellis fragilis TaxID=205917 RepID=A0A4Y9YUB7_9AGAM|nr:hypothetical protein EVG20_g5315 [Dentipellis fragilis]